MDRDFLNSLSPQSAPLPAPVARATLAAVKGTKGNDATHNDKRASSPVTAEDFGRDRCSRRRPCAQCVALTDAARGNPTVHQRRAADKALVVAEERAVSRCRAGFISVPRDSSAR